MPHGNGQIMNMNTKIYCRHCPWSGEVGKCVYDPASLNGDEDGPHAYNCPGCKKTLAIQGWLGFDAVPTNAFVY